jgi:mannose-6-phosphate isomerase-like protein (cupin superfamily)
MTAVRNDVPSGPWEELGVDLVVDEDQAQSWVERLGPQEERPFHTHRVPWLTIVVSGGRAVSTDHLTGEQTPVELRTGEVKFNPLPEGESTRHALRNVGDTELVLVAVQLSPAPTSPAKE